MNTSLYSKWIRFFIVSFIVFVSFVLMRYTFLYLFPFLLSAFVANITFPIVQKIEAKWKLSRTITTVFVLFSFIFVHLCLIFVSASLLIAEVNTIIETLPTHFERMKMFILYYYDERLLPRYEIIQRFAPFLPILSDWNVAQYVEFIVDKMDVSSSHILTILMKSASFAFASLSSILTIMLVFFIATFLMVKDYEKLITYIHRFFPKRVIRTLKNISEHGLKTAFAFLKAQFLIALLSSSIVFLGFVILRIEHPFTIAMIVLLIDLIPYIGIGFFFIPWIIYSFLTKQFDIAIQLSVVYSVVVIMRQFIEPRMIAKQIGIHPLVALLVLFAGFQYFGLIGIVITPLILIVVSTLYKANLFHYVWHYIQYGSFIR
ncbi:MAG TPA: sporulation integral membrane protein YtvI [Pseudogracilibacillus sp.]|nr:sporulation integral membrane protein YtvI [Pseudogracilibacillus sp.]